MKILYLILWGVLCSLPVKANSTEFADRHPIALKNKTFQNKENIIKVTREANHFLYAEREEKDTLK